MQLRFKDSQHEKFFLECMAHSKRDDSYHRAIFYTLGINPDIRANIQTLFDFKKDQIKPEGLERGWQTSGSTKVTLFAFNIWNGYADEKLPSTPYDLFCCESAPYFFEAVKLKYPEYCPPEHRKTVKHDAR